MYKLPYFQEKDENKILAFIREHPFAFITGCDDDKNPVATQIPMFIEERDGNRFLSGHIMKNTDHHRAFLQNPKVLCVFTGAHSYVSATWYSDPHQASTWNYMSVHLHGIIRFLDDAALVDILRKASLYFENGNRQSSTVYDNLPAGYTEKLMKAIVAFEIEVTKMDHVFKLSQNRDEKSYLNIIEHLRSEDPAAQGIAGEMEKRKDELYH